MRTYLHEDDLPDSFDPGQAVAIDCETLGLRHGRDRLCLVQVSAGDGAAHLVRVANPVAAAPRLQGMLVDERVLKIFHFGRFDIASLYRSYGVLARPVYCTRIASLFARTFTNRHSLKQLCSDLLDVSLDKEEQTSDWGRPYLTDAQLQYAAADVVHLHRIRECLDAMLQREGRVEFAQRCFEFLPWRARIDVEGWGDMDIFSHGATP